jgi:hypothetical protein
MSNTNNPSTEEKVKSFAIVIAAIIGWYFFYQAVQNEDSENSSKTEIEIKDTNVDAHNAEDKTSTEIESEVVNEQETSSPYADCPKCGSLYNPRSWGEMCPKCWKNGEALKCPHGNIDSPKFCDLCYPN